MDSTPHILVSPTKRIVVSLILIMVALVSFVPQQILTAQEKPPIRARLLAETNDASRPFTIGIRFTMSDNWYLYWKNPGDAGLPIDIQWQLPKGFTADPILYPSPKKKKADEAICYVYERDVVLLTTIRPPEGYTQTNPIQLTAQLDWLACRERCVRGSDTVSINIGSISDTRLASARALLASTWAAMPRSLAVNPRLAASATMHRPTNDSVTIIIGVAGNGANHISDFFPVVPDDYVLNHGAIMIKDNRILIPLLSLKPNAAPDTIEGLLLIGSRAYSVSVHVAHSRSLDDAPGETPQTHPDTF